MKKALMTAAMLVVMLSTSALAQRYGYPSPAPSNYPQQPGYGQRSSGSGYGQPGYGQPNYNYNYDYDYDDYRFDRHLDWWDRELNLTRRQEREIRRIRERFEQQSRGINARDSRQRDAMRQLRQREFIDMMAVLGPEQRDRVIDRMRPYERSAGRGPGRNNGMGYGRGPGYGPYGYKVSLSGEERGAKQPTALVGCFLLRNLRRNSLSNSLCLSHKRITKTGALLTLAAATALAQPSANHPKMTQNPFLLPYATPHQTAPFDKITNPDYLPALREGLAQGRRDVAMIVNNPAPPTFENTIVALERSGDLLSRVTSVLFNLNSAETSPELQQIVKEASPLLSEYGNDITLNEELFARVKAVYDGRAGLKLDPESAMLLEKAYKRFARNGANLHANGKERLRAIDKELAQLSLQFGENVLNETNEYLMPVTDEKDLAGLPDYVREAAKATAKQKGKDGWVFTLQAPSYGPFMQHADNRDLRRKLYMAYNGRGFHGDKNDNQAIVSQIVGLRYERANLLDYKTHADFVLEESMAGSRGKVQSFLDELVTYARPAAERQLAELTAYAKTHGFAEDKLQAWDNSYYAEKLKKEKYDLDDETLKPYFKLDNVLNGAFTIANKLYGITFKERTDIPVYNSEVKTYDVFDRDGKFLAVFYGDYFPRAGKRSGAWMNDVQGQKIENGQNVRPHIVNVCNFTRPTDTKPSLLTFGEVTTLFHEFGHGLHGMLANGTYESLSGTNVPRDFVELPSQVMENWCYDPEALKLFAKHYQTGEVIPNELIEKIRASQNFLAGLANLRQLRFGLVDMYYHGQKPTSEGISAVESRVDSVANLFPHVEGVAVSPAFSHIFAGGYSAGYYSYKWSEVLDADAFEFFREKGGLDNKAAADSFRRNVLEKGGSEKPMELYKKFRGREPSPKAMLRRSGLIL